MDTKIEDLLSQIQKLENELEEALAQRADQFMASLDPLKEDFLKQHAELKIGLWIYLRASNPLSIITAPIIYSLIIPFLLTDIFVTIYQYICFPVYGLKRVRRSDYFVFDRRHLEYLNTIEKFNCTYCSYANGLIAYVREVASLTEAHWCPIKHATHSRKAHHARYQNFADYGDAEAYRKTGSNKGD